MLVLRIQYIHTYIQQISMTVKGRPKKATDLDEFRYFYFCPIRTAVSQLSHANFTLLYRQNRRFNIRNINSWPNMQSKNFKSHDLQDLPKTYSHFRRTIGLGQHALTPTVAVFQSPSTKWWRHVGHFVSCIWKAFAKKNCLNSEETLFIKGKRKT